jgi:hypothetical protein
MPLKAKLYFLASIEPMAGSARLLAEDTGFVSSTPADETKRRRDETIFHDSRRHPETSAGY